MLEQITLKILLIKLVIKQIILKQKIIMKVVTTNMHPFFKMLVDNVCWTTKKKTH